MFHIDFYLKNNTSYYDVIDTIPLHILILVIFKSIIESALCLCIIIINLLIIVNLLQTKRLRIAQNLLLLNVACACILFSLSSILSISLTLYIVHIKLIISYLCQLIGFLIIASCHSLMFSYTLIAMVRFLTIIYPFNKKIISMYYIKLYLILKWILAFLIPGISLILPNQQIKFQSKAKIVLFLMKDLSV